MITEGLVAILADRLADFVLTKKEIPEHSEHIVVT
jgi:hypothetical protein